MATTKTEIMAITLVAGGTGSKTNRKTQASNVAVAMVSKGTKAVRAAMSATTKVFWLNGFLAMVHCVGTKLIVETVET